MSDWFQQHAPVLFGLFAGTIAHFGSRIAKGQLPSWLYFIGFAMQLGVIGLFAASFMEWLQLGSGIWEATLTAIFAMSTHEVVEWSKKDGWKRVLKAAFPSIMDDEKESDDAQK